MVPGPDGEMIVLQHDNIVWENPEVKPGDPEWEYREWHWGAPVQGRGPERKAVRSKKNPRQSDVGILPHKEHLMTELVEGDRAHVAEAGNEQGVGLLGTLKNLGGGFWEVVPYFDEEKPLTFHVNQVLYRDRIRMFDSKHPKHLIWRWQLGELASDNSRKNPRRRNPDYDEQIRRANSEWVNVDVMSASELVGPDYFFAWTERGVSPQRMLEVINAAVLLRANALAKGRLRDAERTGYIPSEEEAIELVEALQERVAEQYGVSWLRFRVAEILEDLPEGQPVHGPLGEELGKLKARGARRIMHGYGRARRNG